MALALLSLLLMTADQRFPQMQMVRAVLALAVTPLQWLVNAPAQSWNLVGAVLQSRESLRDDKARLESRLLVLEGKVQKLAALETENIRLRQLLNASDVLDERVLVAEVVAVDPDPFSHKVLINKGSRDQVRVGQPVLDARGLMGQVVQVDPGISRVLLITDANHAVPVQVARNGLRAIAVGTSTSLRLELIHVPDTADIRVGDQLYSSGMGLRFPPGYPVGVVLQVEHDPGQPFARVLATPSAELDRSRHVLLVFKDEPQALQEQLDAGAQSQ